ncbi:hypothetical protein BC834DRAFT_972894 [Gloeopeniophorella convolvens]|nr:hypothetical protein BC834DRAFT_972894 [Gloeopeniophorella convolvens]
MVSTIVATNLQPAFDPSVPPRAYHPSEKLQLEFWDSQRLAAHTLAALPPDVSMQVVDFILTKRVGGAFFATYADQVDDLLSNEDRAFAHIIAEVLPFRMALGTHLASRHKLQGIFGDIYVPPARSPADDAVSYYEERLPSDFDWEPGTPEPDAETSLSPVLALYMDSGLPSADAQDTPPHSHLLLNLSQDNTSSIGENSVSTPSYPTSPRGSTDSSQRFGDTESDYQPLRTAPQPARTLATDPEDAYFRLQSEDPDSYTEPPSTPPHPPPRSRRSSLTIRGPPSRGVEAAPSPDVRGSTSTSPGASFIHILGPTSQSSSPSSSSEPSATHRASLIGPTSRNPSPVRLPSPVPRSPVGLLSPLTLNIPEPQTTLGHDIFTSPALADMEFPYPYPTPPPRSNAPHAAHASLRAGHPRTPSADRTLFPVRLADAMPPQTRAPPAQAQAQSPIQLMLSFDVAEEPAPSVRNAAVQTLHGGVLSPTGVHDRGGSESDGASTVASPPQLVWTLCTALAFWDWSASASEAGAGETGVEVPERVLDRALGEVDARAVLGVAPRTLAGPSSMLT